MFFIREGIDESSPPVLHGRHQPVQGLDVYDVATGTF